MFKREITTHGAPVGGVYQGLPPIFNNPMDTMNMKVVRCADAVTTKVIPKVLFDPNHGTINTSLIFPGSDGYAYRFGGLTLDPITGGFGIGTALGGDCTGTGPINAATYNPACQVIVYAVDYNYTVHPQLSREDITTNYGALQWGGPPPGGLGNTLLSYDSINKLWVCDDTAYFGGPAVGTNPSWFNCPDGIYTMKQLGVTVGTAVVSRR